MRLAIVLSALSLESFSEKLKILTNKINEEIENKGKKAKGKGEDFEFEIFDDGHCSLLAITNAILGGD